MPCRYPLEAVQKESGGKPVVYKRGRRPKTLAEGLRALELPCGQCSGCRLEKSRQWGVRMACEAAYWWEFHNVPSSFITLTYDEQHLPDYGTLLKEDLQNFLRRLKRSSGENIRYYASGEYGTTCVKHGIKDCPECGTIQRPHYHAIIFGFGFPDKYYVGEREGVPVYNSEFLDETWGKGLTELGHCEFQSAAYVARYVMKKVTGPEAEDHYMRYCWMRDRFSPVEPEFAIMSKNPGIGMPWIGIYHEDVYRLDEMPIPGRGVLGVAPKYFDKLVEKWELYDFEEIKDKRRTAMAESLINGPSMEDRAEVQDAKLKLLGRKL